MSPKGNAQQKLTPLGAITPRISVIQPKNFFLTQMPFINQANLGRWHRNIHSSATNQAPADIDRDLNRGLIIYPSMKAYLKHRQSITFSPRMQKEFADPMAEFRYRVGAFIDCADRQFIRTVEDYASTPHVSLDFDGVAVYVDQEGSTGMAKRLSKEEFEATNRMMDSYFKAGLLTYALMKDIKVGDAVSAIGKSPNKNPAVVAVEAARFLLTTRNFFRDHNTILDDMIANGQTPGVSHLYIRGAMGFGRVTIDNSDIQQTTICSLMNEVARLSGIPAVNTVICNKESAEYLKPYFILREIKVGGELLEEIERLTDRISQVEKDPDTQKYQRLLSLYECVYQRMQITKVIHDAFERPNLPEDFGTQVEEAGRQARATAVKAKRKLDDVLTDHSPNDLDAFEKKNPGLGKFLIYKKSMDADKVLLKQIENEIVQLETGGALAALKTTGEALGSAGNAIGTVIAHDSTAVAKIERKIDGNMGAPKYAKYAKAKFKGMSLEELGVVYEILDYTPFASDAKAAPKNSLFHDLFIRPMAAKELERAAKLSPEDLEKLRAFEPDDLQLLKQIRPCDLERMVLEAGLEYGLPARTDYNLFAAYYIMYIMQHSGSPDFAYQTATRAAGVAAYALEKIQGDWQKTSTESFDVYVRKGLVSLGVFAEDGSIDRAKFDKFMKEHIIIPSLASDIGIIELYREVFGSARDTPINPDEGLTRGEIAELSKLLSAHKRVDLADVEQLLKENNSELELSRNNVGTLESLLAGRENLLRQDGLSPELKSQLEAEELTLREQLAAAKALHEGVRREIATLKRLYANSVSASKPDQLREVAGWLAAGRGELDTKIADRVMHRNELSAKMLRRLNEQQPGAFPEETIAIVDGISFVKKTDVRAHSSLGAWADASDENEKARLALIQFATEIVMASRAMQSMLKPPAYKTSSGNGSGNGNNFEKALKGLETLSLSETVMTCCKELYSEAPNNGA